MRVLAFVLLAAGAFQEPAAESPLVRARARFEEARIAERNGGDFDTPGKAAIAAFDEAVKADPASAEARAGRGDVRAAMAAWRMPRGDFSKRAEFEAAIADYDEALKLDPTRAATFAGRGFARFKLSVARFFARVHVDELFRTGFEDLDQAVKLLPADASLRILRGDAQQEKAVYARYRADPHKAYAEAALTEYAEAARLDPATGPGLESRVAASKRLAGLPAAVDDKGLSIAWTRTWEEARREAAIRRVPIFIYVSGGAG